MKPPATLRYGARLALVYGCAVLICMQFGPAYVRLLLPVFQREIQWLAPQYAVRSLATAEVQGEQAIVLQVTTAGYVAARAGWLAPGVTMSSATLRGHVYQPVIVMACLLLPWPARRQRDYFSRIVLALPLLLAVEGLDVPQVLLGSIDDLLASPSRPAGAARSFPVYWMNFLNGGGRAALSITASLLALAMQQYISARRTQSGTSPSIDIGKPRGPAPAHRRGMRTLPP